MSKNSCLSSGAKLLELKKLRNEKLQSSCGEENAKSKKAKPEETVKIEVGSTSVDVETLCPGKRASLADLQILLKEDQLAAVFGFLKADCQIEDHSKRSYNKSGRFAKGVKKDGK